eukprot:3178913-Rhodomonas_salina.1
MARLEAGRIRSLTDSLWDCQLWLASECTSDLPDTPQGRWWICKCSYLNPAVSVQYIFEGRAHEPEGGREYAITLDTLAHALNLTAETQAELEVEIDLAQLGILQSDVLPMIISEYWQDQLSRGLPIPWTISHSLPCQPKLERGVGRQHPLQLATPAGSSLWQMVTAIHSFDFQTDQYTVEMSTGATSLTRWGALDFAKLAGTLCCSPALYLPSADTSRLPSSGQMVEMHRTQHC